MTAKEILKTILENSSLNLEAFEYGITDEDITNAIREIEEDKEKLREIERTKHLPRYKNETSLLNK